MGAGALQQPRVVYLSRSCIEPASHTLQAPLAAEVAALEAACVDATDAALPIEQELARLRDGLEEQLGSFYELRGSMQVGGK